MASVAFRVGCSHGQCLSRGAGLIFLLLLLLLLLLALFIVANAEDGLEVRILLPTSLAIVLFDVFGLFLRNIDAVTMVPLFAPVAASTNPISD